MAIDSGLLALTLRAAIAVQNASLRFVAQPLFLLLFLEGGNFAPLIDKN